MKSCSTLPYNEPLTNFDLESPFREKLTQSLNHIKYSVKEVPLVINGKKFMTDEIQYIRMPSDKSRIIAKTSMANEEHIKDAIKGSVAARKFWQKFDFEKKAKIFEKACYLMTTKYRSEMLAATMLGQSKTAYQADIDCICELSDFIRFNIKYARDIYNGIELHQPNGISNSVSYRPLDGFIVAIAPFNFTAIAGNLCTAPAMMGNVVLWKPSNGAILSSYLFYEILLESGLPEGVIQFLPSDSSVFKVVFKDENFAAINFTGSTQTFETIWRDVGNNIHIYRNYPRLIGETGGKNYHLVHESADIDLVVNCTIRSAFEYGGQKCSACSRIYVPDNLFEKFKELMVERMKTLHLGQPDNYTSFLSAVINERSFKKIRSYIQMTETDKSLKILYGGKCDDSKGYFVDPTLILVDDKNHQIMHEEIFGPVLSVYIYKTTEWKDIVSHVADFGKYALTGSVFCADRKILSDAEDELINSVGNFYVNDKSTGSVVGQQPFGGARKSGTNDKSGMGSYLLRFVSPHSRKENYQASSDIKYSYMK